QLAPQQWIGKGASESYVSQLKTAKQELEYFDQAAQSLQQQPEKLSAALDTYFRFEEVEWRLQAGAGGGREYQDPGVGDTVLRILGENSANRDGLRQYISDLAKQKEQEFSVIDKEAERCRVEVTRPVAAPARKNGK